MLRETLEAIDTGRLDGGYRKLYAAAAIGQLVAGCPEAAATHADQAIACKRIPVILPTCRELLSALPVVEALDWHLDVEQDSQKLKILIVWAQSRCYPGSLAALV
ncbi:MAG: hypothetical protein ABIS28_21015 [Caldimonas sp.]